MVSLGAISQNDVPAPLPPRRCRADGSIGMTTRSAAIRQERVTASARSKSFPDVTRFG